MSGNRPDIVEESDFPISVRARILSGEEGVAETIQLLRSGEVVGIPTETVYGLAGHAFNPLAIARIFEVKGRPLTDPLIVHLGDPEVLSRVARWESDAEKALVSKLAESFWPGPLTILLKKNPDIPDLVTSGSESVAVRVPSHPLFQQVLKGLGAPVAAPSANRFGKISPTSPRDVLFELGKSIEAILDGGPCAHGVESTIVRVSGERIEILRHGPITEEDLRKFGQIVSSNRNGNTPGSLPGHYAPGKRLSILETDIKDLIPEPGSAFLAFRQPAPDVATRFHTVKVLSPKGDLREAAVQFYGHLRALDQSAAVQILAEPLPEEGIGKAIMDRLRRASYGSLHETGHSG
jgi:L-threonylcarbamoyladenylate synthase